ncbi:hypothetical protein SGQ83_07185 [Flavobacterium sp. Fl-318]|uniref:DUF4783 domain-containing protein n=1 Tax=Flavobacterium cupriresistens TaxID=2893885 RepID=A0ABU4RAU9_9FLAO|nr:MULTISPECIES: hypothetical protein [unclassified Flavobacterium]MDX6189123.1 hypothetical protein [Flavobacterium sp. Fl-318]UFH41220.1 hypothetical protein LNP23_15555 [Flavobacterium sp. F-323]
MKKITILLFLVSSFVYSQNTDVKIFIEKTETVNFDQYDLIKKVNQYYPDIFVSRNVTNYISNNLKVQQILFSQLIYELPSDCEYYTVKISDNTNTSLYYNYKLKDGTYIYGDVRLFNGGAIRTLFKVKDNERVSRYYVNGILKTQ